jgi:hypothetical protein
MTRSATRAAATVRALRPAGRTEPTDAVGLAVAVVAAAGPPLTVHAAGADRPAVPAAGCLVAPVEGDRVLVAIAGADCFVLQVLERSGPAPLTVSPAHGARLEIAAPHLRLSAGEEIAVAAPSLVARVDGVRLVTRTATLLGRLMTVVGDRLRTTVRRQEVAADHLAAKLGERVTVVDGADVFSAAMVMETVSGTMTTQTGSAVTTAKRDLRFDAERVSVG